MAQPAPGLAALVVQARRALRAALGARVASRGLGPREGTALIELLRIPSATPGALAEAMGLDAPATSRVVGALLRRKLVEQRPDREDRRRTRLLPTDAGRALGAELASTAEALEAEAARGLSPEELALLRRGLARVTENLRTAAVAPAAPQPRRR